MLGSLILNTVTRAAFPTVLVFSIYLLFAGHNAPGGGFVGGLTAGAALVLRYASRGVEGLRPVLPEWLRFELLLGLGLTLAAVTILTPAAFGEPIFTIHHYNYDVPVLGEIKLGTALFFDTGVWLIVAGLVLGILEMLGGQPDQPSDETAGHDEAPESSASAPLPRAADGADPDHGGESRPTTGADSRPTTRAASRPSTRSAAAGGQEPSSDTETERDS